MPGNPLSTSGFHPPANRFVTITGAVAPDGLYRDGVDPARPDPPALEPVTCARCGATAEELPLTWSASVERRGSHRRTVHHCDRCSRENVRSIEGRLDEAWW